MSLNPSVVNNMRLPEKFETKDQYLTWRMMWRARYAELTGAIMASKTAVKIASKEKAPAGQFQYDCLRFREEARLFMELRTKSKQMVRVRMRELGFEAPEPKCHEKPAPREKKKYTADEIRLLRAQALKSRTFLTERFEKRHRETMASADAHSD